MHHTFFFNLYEVLGSAEMVGQGSPHLDLALPDIARGAYFQGRGIYFYHEVLFKMYPSQNMELLYISYPW